MDVGSLTLAQLSDTTHSFSSVTFIISFSFLMANRETNKPFLLSAMLGSKDKVVMMQLFSNH